MNNMVSNPFGQPQTAVAATVDTEQARAMQEVQAAMVVAKRFPRDQIAATDKILQACARQSLAEGALYSYARGGTNISGPSIRLAETMAQSWGNIQCGVRELSSTNGTSTMEAYAWDLETNSRINKVFQVEHVRYSSSGGKKKLVDPRDVYENNANNAARRLRSCILAVIPGDVTEAAVNQCSLTMQANVDMSNEGINKMLAAFERIFVTKEMIEKRIQRRIEAITPGLVVQLRNIRASIKDGMSEAADWFEVSAVTRSESTDGLNDAITSQPEKPARKRAATAEKKQEAEPAQAEAAAEETGEINYAYIAQQMNDAKCQDDLDVACSLISSLQDKGQKEELILLAGAMHFTEDDSEEENFFG